MNILLLLFTTLASFGGISASGVAPGNFSLSCTSINLRHGFFLGATCCRPVEDSDTDSAESESDNQLDLTMCIGLDQVAGRMQWEVYGKFSNYCANCTLMVGGHEGHVLTCFCRPLVGGKGVVRSSLNLDEGITNDMGTLKCDGGMASSGDGHGL
ncbi:CVNH domain-containing protein [Staphylotrichum tortipilum]|uniref:CVNH domain-containing protein n=1 Tax=Staphylotrichum tortipilum TaxID=2831512 RepID=A0AAN6MB19_9PEZI|nr:CVNH domain-containing protein [Staphylotrichum longicolle]